VDRIVTEITPGSGLPVAFVPFSSRTHGPSIHTRKVREASAQASHIKAKQPRPVRALSLPARPRLEPYTTASPSAPPSPRNPRRRRRGKDPPPDLQSYSSTSRCPGRSWACFLLREKKSLFFRSVRWLVLDLIAPADSRARGGFLRSMC
jgi:hypothetical protein